MFRPGSADGRTQRGAEVIEQFTDAESNYLEWLAAHPRGYVLNSERRPRPSNLVLHRASCKSISTSWSNYTTRDYIKTCSDSRDELRQWASHTVGGEPRDCSLCKP